ncbi:MAG: Cna B-type domain-containing protein, partial [Eubacteriales bacterium]|nr:Cna B-type domain-containing protein [Eubacteriales bacterium]
YTVSADGLVTFTFYQDYNTNNDDTVNTFEITGSAEYNPNITEDETRFLYRDGSQVIVVVNPGDFEVEKKAVRQYTAFGTTSKIDYTVKVSSEIGTNEKVTVEDNITAAGGGILSATLDAGSIQITDASGNAVTEYDLTTTATSYKIENLPALGRDGVYNIKYTVSVALTPGARVSGNTVKNKVDVTSETTKSDDATITYGSPLAKAYSSYDSQKGLLWSIQGSTNGMDMTGVTLTDTADVNIKSMSVIYVYDAGGNASRIDNSNAVIDGKKFTFTFPARDYSKIVRYTVDYYTEGTISGANVTATNSVVMQTPSGDTWSHNDVQGIGVNVTSSISKQNLGMSGEDSRKADLNWSISADYTGLENTERKYIEIRDVLTGYFWNDTNQYNQNWEGYGVHYALASELDAALKNDSTGVRITVEKDGETTTMSYSEAISAGYNITFRYYKTSASHEYTSANQLSGDNAGTWVRSFYIRVDAKAKEPLNIKNISVASYPTHFHKEAIQRGSRWRLVNTAQTLFSTSAGDYIYNVEHGAFEKLVRQRMEGTSPYYIWTSGTPTLDYDDNNGKVEFLLLATVPEGQTEVHIEDTLPAGLSLGTIGDGSSGAVTVGVYTGSGFRLGSWNAGARGSSVNIGYSGNTLTVDLTNVGTGLPLLQNRMIGVRLICDVAEDLGGSEGITSEVTGNSVYEVKTFNNTAAFGELSDSASVVVKKEQDILSKSGVQSATDTSTVHYTIAINKDGADLLPEGDVLTLVDRITSSELGISLQKESIKLYRMNGDGSRGEEAAPLTLVTNYAETDKSGIMSQSFEMTISDGTPYILEYDYTVEPMNESSQGNGTLNNVAELTGIISASDGTEVSDANSSATSDHASLNLYKVDSDNTTIYLENATFKLEKYVSGSYQTVQEAFDVSGQNGKTFDYYSKSSVLEGNTLYRIIETKAPEGYELDETPFYFIIKGNVEDVRSGKINATQLTISSDEEAIAAAGADGGLPIHLLSPSKGSYFDLPNRKIPEKVSVKVTKDWADGENQDGIRPDSITVVLVKDNEETEETAILNKDNGWTADFTGLLKYDGEREIAYSVKEKNVPEGYTASISGDMTAGYLLTNTHEPETIKIEGQKTWNDDKNAGDKRPEEIQVILYKGEEKVASAKVRPDEDGNWKYAFENLPKNENGNIINYRLEEAAVAGYTSAVDG